jgi:hypothetical protein
MIMIKAPLLLNHDRMIPKGLCCALLRVCLKTTPNTTILSQKIKYMPVAGKKMKKNLPVPALPFFDISAPVNVLDALSLLNL